MHGNSCAVIERHYKTLASILINIPKPLQRATHYPLHQTPGLECIQASDRVGRLFGAKETTRYIVRSMRTVFGQIRGYMASDLGKEVKPWLLILNNDPNVFPLSPRLFVHFHTGAYLLLPSSMGTPRMGSDETIPTIHFYGNRTLLLSNLADYGQAACSERHTACTPPIDVQLVSVAKRQHVMSAKVPPYHEVSHTHCLPVRTSAQGSKPLMPPGQYIPPHRRQRDLPAAQGSQSMPTPSHGDRDTQPQWVDPPTRPLYHGSDGDWILTHWRMETSTEDRISRFLDRWPPSRTPSTYCAWIAIDRYSDQDLKRLTEYEGGETQGKDVEGLQRNFQALIEKGKEYVTVQAIDEIARANNVLVGKWMIMTESNRVDDVWGKVVRYVCLRRKLGQAKVSTSQVGCLEERKHVICVYVRDYLDLEDVRRVKDDLKKWVCGPVSIGFKTDAYTYLNIYSNNEYGLRPSRYRSEEI